MANRATRRIAHHHDSSVKAPEADDPAFTVVRAGVFHFNGYAVEDESRILEVEAAIRQRLLSLDGIVVDAHPVIVYTETVARNRRCPRDLT